MTVPLAPLAHTTSPETALTPRNRAVTPDVSGSHCGAALEMTNGSSRASSKGAWR